MGNMRCAAMHGQERSTMMRKMLHGRLLPVELVRTRLR